MQLPKSLLRSFRNPQRASRHEKEFRKRFRESSKKGKCFFYHLNQFTRRGKQFTATYLFCFRTAKRMDTCDTSTKKLIKGITKTITKRRKTTFVIISRRIICPENPSQGYSIFYSPLFSVKKMRLNAIKTAFFFLSEFKHTIGGFVFDKGIGLSKLGSCWHRSKMPNGRNGRMTY